MSATHWMVPQITAETWAEAEACASVTSVSTYDSWAGRRATFTRGDLCLGCGRTTWHPDNATNAARWGAAVAGHCIADNILPAQGGFRDAWCTPAPCCSACHNDGAREVLALFRAFTFWYTQRAQQSLPALADTGTP